MKIKKTNSFLLFEVIIALLLISMSIIPFTSLPYKVFKKEMYYLEKMVIDPIATNTFAQIIHNDFSIDSIGNMNVPFGENSIIHIKRNAKITKNYDEKSGNTLITISVNVQSKNAFVEKEKLFFIPHQREQNDI